MDKEQNYGIWIPFGRSHTTASMAAQDIKDRCRYVGVVIRETDEIAEAVRYVEKFQ